MVGGDGTKRKYLLLIMNNAEVRSLSGMPGSFAVITAKDGRLKMGEQGGILDVRPLAKPPPGAKLSKDEKLVFQTLDRHGHPEHGHPPGLSRGPPSWPRPSPASGGSRSTTA